MFQKTAGSDKVYGKKGEGGISKYSVEKFLTQIAETFRRGTLNSFISFGYRKCLCFRGFCHDFPSKYFCLTVPKHFVEEPFCAVFQNYSGSEKFYGKKGGGLGDYLNLSLKLFLSHTTEIFRRGNLHCCVSEN